MPPVLKVSGLVKRFGALCAVDAVSFEVGAGEIFGLIGPDGAGKTTAMRLLAGLVRPDAGSIFALGSAVPKDVRQVRAAMGYMPQQYSLYGDLSVQENLRFFAGMYGVPQTVLEARERRLLDIARLEGFRARPAAALSGGMYKKLALCCALMHEPRLLLLDEPTNGVDPISRRELWALLKELVGEGVGVLVSTPYMDEAERCDRVGLLVEGALVACDSPRALAASFTHAVLELATATPVASALVSALPGVVQVYTVGRKLHVVVDDAEPARRTVTRALAAAHVEVLGLAVVPASFEDVFLYRSQLAAGRRAT